MSLEHSSSGWFEASACTAAPEDLPPSLMQHGSSVAKSFQPPRAFVAHDRLHAELDRSVAERPSRAAQADIIRLLFYTGCRSGEIRNLKWDEVGVNTLDLGDSKTGPRRVYLNSEACVIIKRQPRTDSPHVFPSPMNPSQPFPEFLSLWRLVRRRTGIEDVRLHDLRHNFASWAVMRGVPLPTVARLLGHRQVSMTLRYAHVHDKEVEAAAERVGRIITNIWDRSGSYKAVEGQQFAVHEVSP